MRNSAKLVCVVLVLALIALVGCSKPPPPRTTPAAKPATVTVTPEVSRPAPELGFASTAAYDALEKENAKVKPNVPGYTVETKLANVVNRAQFKSLLEPKLTALIIQNGFAVTPTNFIQMSQIYDSNQYEHPIMPSFITTDSMLHIYHVFYDYTLRSVESNKLYDTAIALTNAMIAASQSDLKQATTADLKDAAIRNLAYFAVAKYLLSGATPPTGESAMVQGDLGRIHKGIGRAVSDILGVKVDFSQFVPRGHYTRSEKLKKYFRAMMWYGLTAFPAPTKKIGPEHTLRAVMITRNLATAQGNPMKLWDTIYEPTAFYVGTADDYTFRQYQKLMDKVYGKKPQLADFADKGKLKSFIAEVDKLPKPRIENFVDDPLAPTGPQFRFMGQRFIADSRIMQEMTHPKVNGRNFPKGLDVFAAMGSERALDILDKTDGLKSVSGFVGQMNKMRKEVQETPRARWQSNLYYGWLWSLQSVTAPAPAGYPSFMQSAAWQDKSLFTALGSWTELRHDTILYAKQSGTECGGGEDEDSPPPPKNYVEPNLEFWTRLKWLNAYTRDGLAGRGLLDETLKDKFTQVGDLIDFCRKITIKELTGKKVTDAEYWQMSIYGGNLEQLMLSFAGGDVLSETDKDMALVADVHTSFDQCLEEGTGRAAAIYVVVPIQGKLYLTRGAIYTHYEFQWPASDRLTDEKWQKMLKGGKEPGFADWVKSFLVPTKKKPVPEFENYFDGC